MSHVTIAGKSSPTGSATRTRAARLAVSSSSPRSSPLAISTAREAAIDDRITASKRHRIHVRKILV